MKITITKEMQKNLFKDLTLRFTNDLYKLYADVNFAPNYKNSEGCNLEEVIQEYLQERHPKNLDIPVVAENIANKLCCKDCKKCKL